jgi:hypothetical protein
LAAPGGKRPLIVFATSLFGLPVDIAPLAGAACEFSTDLRRLSEAAAVVFHVPDLDDVPRLKKYRGQLWAGWCMESAQNVPLLADPRFEALFDLRMTYERRSDVWAPYLPYERDFEAALATPVPPKTAAAPVCMFQTSDFNKNGRNEYAAELMRSLPVHSYGRHLHNRDIEGPDDGRETKMRLFGSYRFCIAFENSVCEDYVTEKFFDPLLAGSVPVYLGAPNIDAFAPGDHAFINTADFAGPRELAAYLLDLCKNEAVYQRYFAWRQRGLSRAFQQLLAQRGSEPFLKLADLVATRQRDWRPLSMLQRMQARTLHLYP